MSKKETNELSAEQLAVLNESYPISDSNSRVSLPRFGMLAKDITEEEGTGRNKKIKVIQSAGTFYTEKDIGETDEHGKKVWTKEFIEDENVDVIITFHRRQLRYYDNGLNKFISSPIYDTADQVINLYLDKRVIAKGNQAQLQALYPITTEKGKPSSKLKEETILYVLYEDELYQFNLSQSSKWSFKDYSKKVNPSTVITTLSSVEETNGSNTYRKVMFNSKRLINGDEFTVVNENQTLLKDNVISDGKYFLTQASIALDSGGKDKDGF